MKNFESFYKFGMTHRDGNSHAVHLPGYALSDKERDYLKECIFAFMKSQDPQGKKLEVVDVFLGAFLSGVTYSGAYFGPGAPDDEEKGEGSVNIFKKTV